MRHNPRKDRNHNEIKELFEGMGLTVWDAAGGHGGIPDLIVGYGCVSALVEVKDGKKAPSERRLTSSQNDYFVKMQGANFVVKNVDEAIAVANWIIELDALCNSNYIEVPLAATEYFD